MSKPTLREMITKECKDNEWGTDDAMLYEVFTEYDTVDEGKTQKHRWYNVVPTVKKVGDRFFRYAQYSTTGDGSISDMGIEPSIDNAKEVFPVQVMTTVYKERN